MNTDVKHIQNDELAHYGVLGMKWGVHRALRKSSANSKLQKKVHKYEVKSADRAKKAEQAHRKKDLETANRIGVKSEKYKLKSARLKRKADKTTDTNEKLRLERKSAKYDYKSKALKVDADKITKTKGYGGKAMSKLTASNVYAKKAAKARYKITKNESYINYMKQKASSVSKEDMRDGYDFVKEVLKA